MKPNLFSEEQAARAVCGETICKEGETPHELDEVEICDLFLRSVCRDIDYWASMEDKTEKQKLEGLAFSILAALDGAQIGLTGFLVAPIPPDDGIKFHKEHNANWWPQNYLAQEHVNGDIGGMLHERFHTVLRELELEKHHANLRRNTESQET